MKKAMLHMDNSIGLNELFSITKVSRGLNSLVSQIKEKSLEKIVILKNNEPEAVLVNIDDYIVLKEKEHLLEMIEIDAVVKQRGKIQQPNTMSMEEMFAKAKRSRKK